MSSKIYVTLLSMALLAPVVSAASLWIPGFDPQPVTIISELGVGPEGETTFIIGPGVTSGTFEDSAAFGPATLISGPSTAEIIYNDATNRLTMDVKCAINGGVADCVATGAADGSTMSYVGTDTVSPFEVQGSFGTDGASVPTPTSSPVASNSAGTPASTPSAGSGVSNGPAVTGSSSPSSSASAQNSGASGTVQPFAAAFVGLILTISGLFVL